MSCVRIFYIRLSTGNFIVAWSTFEIPSGSMYIREFSSTDSLEDPLRIYSPLFNFFFPLVTLHDGAYVLGFIERGYVSLQMFGIPIVEETRVNLHTLGDQLPVIFEINNTFIITWASTGFFPGICGQQFDLKRNPIGNEIVVNDLSTGIPLTSVKTLLMMNGFISVWGNYLSYVDLNPPRYYETKKLISIGK